MKNLTTLEINETLDLLCGFVNDINGNYCHILHVVEKELKSAQTKIDKLYKELERRGLYE